MALDTGTNIIGKIGIDQTTPGTTNAVALSGGVMPAGTALNTYEVLLTTNTTTTPTATLSYISSIVITVDTAGTTSSVTIADKSGTPVTLVNGLSTATAFLAPTIYNFQTPIKMTGGFTIVTAGAVAATVSVWVNYYQ